MTASRALKLGGSLSINPARLIETANIFVQGFGKEGAGGYGSVGSVRLLILTMTLVEDDSPYTI